MGWWEWLWSWFAWGLGHRTATVVLLGLDNAGKSTLLHKLKTGSVRMLPPTQRANIEEIQIDNLTMKAIDLGGHAVVRHLWEEYLLDASAIIFIVDAADVARFDEAKEELDDLLALEAFVDKPFLILANKQDLDGAVGKNDIMERLGLAGCAHDVITAQRPINVFSVSLVNGSGELESALQWLCQAVL